MKKWMASLCVGVLVLTGCAPDFGEQEEEAIIDENLDDSLQETAIIPKHNLSEENYRVLIDSNLSQARGVITNQIANRVDIDELEEGLRRHSKEVFDPETYYFQEGQYLTEDILYDWLERYDEDEEPLGLNPELGVEAEEEADEVVQEAEQDNPKYLSHILEQNYLTKSNDDVVELTGISIGIAMKSVYRFQTEIGGPYYYEDISEDKMLSEANQIADEVVQRIRQIEGLENVPIMLSVFRESSQSSLVPGNFVAKTNIPGDRASIDDWEEINEENVLFPSENGRNTYADTHATLVDFETDVASYFPNYVSVIGKGFYQNGDLQKLTVEIPVSFYGKAELIGFTQYVYGLVLSGFPNDYQLEINITSGDTQEALIVRNPGEEEGFVHIYH
ncbi:CamS family sex pheromone protein [Gracilibacillus massiliensis]|uniref:CamS family sex pheromone protein n=1 Tax=Gracilibacillus massiliensis TaxID=1564956 RepID=UPI00071C370B|nr:CamS family sex pheromone protein [Gracilibacillus massiliensis]